MNPNPSEEISVNGQSGSPLHETNQAGEPRYIREEPVSISLLVPVYNEVGTIELFLQRVTSVLKDYIERLDVVFIDDGSLDNTVQIIKDKRAEYPFVKLISLSRNFGKEAALTAGLDNARGEVVVPIDVDLQDPPEVILEFIEKWRQGYDVVYGHRISRDNDSFTKRHTSGLFYKVFNQLSHVPLPENAGDFRLMDRKVVDALATIRERNRFMKGIFAWVGFDSIAVHYDRPARSAGESKWRYGKLWRFALDGLLGFSTLPLKVWTYLGGMISLVTFCYALYMLIKVSITGVDIPGYASTIVIILFFGGIQLLSFGVLGEYLARVFEESKKRPLYIVKEKIE